MFFFSYIFLGAATILPMRFLTFRSLVCLPQRCSPLKRWRTSPTYSLTCKLVSKGAQTADHCPCAHERLHGRFDAAYLWGCKSFFYHSCNFHQQVFIPATVFHYKCHFWRLWQRCNLFHHLVYVAAFSSLPAKPSWAHRTSDPSVSLLWRDTNVHLRPLLSESCW